jgi:hypothetical protein
MKRRRLLQMGALGTGALGLGVLGYKFVPPAPGKNLPEPGIIATQLFQSFDNDQLNAFVVDYDSPFRQYHNRGVWAGGQPIALGNFSRSQLSLISDLMYSGLSEQGRSIIPSQFYLRVPDIMINNLLLCGEPQDENHQIIFSGPHLNLRIGGKNREGVAFGGPQVYGDQEGNGEPGLPGNMYQQNMTSAMALFHSLDAQQQSQSLVASSPIQTQIEVQGTGGNFDGLAVAALTQEAKAQVSSLIDMSLRPYPDQDVDYARQCIEHHGGINAMTLSYFEDSTYPDDLLYQSYRLEGPGSIFHFQGKPHVHAFINIAMDAENPLSVGELVAENASAIEGVALKHLFESAMTEAEQTDFSYYNLDSVVGRIRPGSVRTGDLYNAESWENRVVTVTFAGNELHGEFRKQLDGEGIQLNANQQYSVATTDYVANDLLEMTFGEAKIASEGGLLRDQLINHIRNNGLG